jgi:hypothetical protein
MPTLQRIAGSWRTFVCDEEKDHKNIDNNGTVQEVFRLIPLNSNMARLTKQNFWQWSPDV